MIVSFFTAALCTGTAWIGRLRDLASHASVAYVNCDESTPKSLSSRASRRSFLAKAEACRGICAYLLSTRSLDFARDDTCCFWLFVKQYTYFPRLLGDA